MGARMETFSSDSIILQEGKKNNRMYIVLEGKVVLYNNYQDEDEYVLGVCGKGKTFGELNLFSEEPCIYTAVAFSDVKLAWFEKSNLDSFIKGYPDQVMNLFENILKSNILLSNNLQLAIKEINELKEMLTKSVCDDETPVTASDIEEFFNTKSVGEYHYKCIF